MQIISVNRVVEIKRIMGKWRAEEEERHMGSHSIPEAQSEPEVTMAATSIRHLQRWIILW
jgi:hypothetical protein